MTTSPGLSSVPQEKIENRLGRKEGEQKELPISSLLPFCHQHQGNTLVHYKVPYPGPEGTWNVGHSGYANCVLFWSICLLRPPPQMQPASRISQTPGSKPLTWELVAIARSKSGVASAIGCHKVGVALNTERKKELSDSGLGSGVIFQGRQQ